MSRVLVIAALSALLLTGCPGDPGKTVEPGKAGQSSESSQSSQSAVADLEKRAQAFWAARVANDVMAAYEYEDAKPLGTMTLQQYAARRSNLVYKRAEVKGAECAGGDEGCVVNVTVEYILPGLSSKPIASDVKDPWRLVQGRWYHQVKTGLKTPDQPKGKAAAATAPQQP